MMDQHHDQAAFFRERVTVPTRQGASYVPGAVMDVLEITIMCVCRGPVDQSV